jgi:1-acyl-sn-glycerol-3-phosphate acyltransferase
MLLITVSTIVLTVILCLLSLFKFIAPTAKSLNWVRRFLAGLAEVWISINNAIFTAFRLTQWDIEVPQDLDRKGCYLVFSNHQSWADVSILQRSFNHRLPFFRFFLKSALIWVPFLGTAWWALDMPFMKRATRETISRRPNLAGKDLENARKACEKFRNIPVSMMSFPEGTRFSMDKRDRTNSSYQHLLKPRIGGIGQVLYALGDQLNAAIDVTIVFPDQQAEDLAPTFWHLVCGQVPRIIVRARKLEIPSHLLGRNFRTDKDFRRELEDWVTQIWLEKDRLISKLEQSARTE